MVQLHDCQEAMEMGSVIGAQGTSLSDLGPGFDLTAGLKIQSQLQGECVCSCAGYQVGNVGLGDRKDCLRCVKLISQGVRPLLEGHIACRFVQFLFLSYRGDNTIFLILGKSTNNQSRNFMK